VNDDDSANSSAQNSQDDGHLPSDQKILDFIDSCEAPPSVKQVARAFKLPQELRAPLRRRLRKLAQSGTLKRQPGRKIASAGQLSEVTVLTIQSVDSDGTLLAVPSDTRISPPPSIRIFPDRKAGRAPAAGQQVLARLQRIDPLNYEGRIMRVLDSTQRRLFGVVVAGRGGFILQSAVRGSRDTIMLEMRPDMPCNEGDLVEAEMAPRRGYLSKTARVIENLGPATSPGAFSALALAEFEIRHVFPEDTIAETDGMKVPSTAGRDDLRKVPFVTIDGADARDFDDAVWAEPTGSGGWLLRVAIADVAHYVRPGSSLDREAVLRGNSVYLPDRVVPMLPEALSNDLCSLRPDEDRAAMVAEITIDKAGEIGESRFCRALIRSCARLTYDRVQSVFDRKAAPRDIGVADSVIDNLFGAWQALGVARAQRAPLALNLKERRVVMDDQGAPVEIARSAQSDSQRLIEDFMITANVAAAQTLIKASRPCVFRIHDMPDPEKTNGLRDLARAVGANLARGQVLRPQHFNMVLRHVRGTPDETMINEAVLRSQSKAVYSIENIGHFGLSLNHYAHFTSPIRRYADLMVHRALIDSLAGKTSAKKEPQEGLGETSLTALSETCVHISETESRAAGAERRTIDRFAAALFAPRAGQVVSGVIAGITGSGTFINLEDGAADGFLPMRSLPDDYYDLDDTGMQMRGRHSGLRFAVGDKMEVLVVEVTPINGGILLAYVEGGNTKDGEPPKLGRKSGPKSGPKSKPKANSRAARRKGKRAG